MTLETAEEINFVQAYERIAGEQHSLAVSKGFWGNKRSLTPEIVLEKIALIHSELSEAVEAARHDLNKQSDVVDHTCVAEELADAIIRIMDLGKAMDLSLGIALIDKYHVNKNRPFKHGKMC